MRLINNAHLITRVYGIACNICQVLLSLAQEKLRNLEAVNDAKTGEQRIFGEIHTHHVFGMP